MSKRSLHLKRTIYDDLSEDEDENWKKTKTRKQKKR